jgi:hypothetical protein
MEKKLNLNTQFYDPHVSREILDYFEQICFQFNVYAIIYGTLQFHRFDNLISSNRESTRGRHFFLLEKKNLKDKKFLRAKKDDKESRKRRRKKSKGSIWSLNFYGNISFRVMNE